MSVIDGERAARAGARGVRLTFGGAAAGLALGIVQAPNPPEVEMVIFGSLILLVAVVEYMLIAAEPPDESPY